MFDNYQKLDSRLFYDDTVLSQCPSKLKLEDSELYKKRKSSGEEKWKSLNSLRNEFLN